MPVNPLSKYLNEVEAAFIKLFSGYIERYEEECLTPERVNLRIRVRFPKGYMLEWNEADNTPHFPGLKTFPNHKHMPDNVIPATRPSVFEVLDEVNQLLRV